MVSINKSFLYGICFASATWIVSLYLYINLTKNEPSTTHTPFRLSKTAHPFNSIKEDSKTYRLKKFFPAGNSKDLIEKLQPVYRKVSTEGNKTRELRTLCVNNS